MFFRQGADELGLYGMTFCFQKAERLLRETTLSVSEIALQLKFTNRTRFYELFRQKYGTTPQQWRKMQKSAERRGFISHEDFYRPATHPIHFASDSPDKIIAALRGRYFSFSQIKSYVVVQSSKICFRLLTTQLQSVILVLERSRT